MLGRMDNSDEIDLVQKQSDIGLSCLSRLLRHTTSRIFTVYIAYV